MVGVLPVIHRMGADKRQHHHKYLSNDEEMEGTKLFKICGLLWSRKERVVKNNDVLIIAAILFGIFFALFAEQCSAFTWEISDYHGFGGHGGVSYWQNTLTLKGEDYVSKKIYLGGRLDYTRYSWGNRLGLGALVGIDFAKIRNLSFFAEGYGGFAVGDADKGFEKQHHNLLKPSPYGIFGAELGVRYKKFTVGVGYDHTSSLESGDKGLNTFGPRIGWRW